MSVDKVESGVELGGLTGVGLFHDGMDLFNLMCVDFGMLLKADFRASTRTSFLSRSDEVSESPSEAEAVSQDI